MDNWDNLKYSMNANYDSNVVPENKIGFFMTLGS